MYSLSVFRYNLNQYNCSKGTDWDLNTNSDHVTPTYLVHLPDAPVLLPAGQVSGQCGQCVFHVVLYCLYQSDYIWIARNICEETKYVQLILPG